MSENFFKPSDLAEFQAYPLDVKIGLTKNRIKDWVYESKGASRESCYCGFGEYISFSGGKDSTVLLHIVRQMYPDIKAVFSDTGLEYPEIREFVKSFDNVDIVYPGTYNRKTRQYDRIGFKQVVTDWGYPIISKDVSNTIHGARLGQKARLDKMHGINVGPKKDHSKYLPLLDAPFKISDHCCSIMKKGPLMRYGKKNRKLPMTAEMACESLYREQQWLKHGCNGNSMRSPKSTPMAFWTDQDVLQYIKQHNLPMASVYGDIAYSDNPDQLDFDGVLQRKLCTTGCQRTGCIFCAFGAHLEKGESRFQRLARTHPKQYEYCIGGGEWNGKLWQPNNKGLGMGFVFDWINDIYGKDFIQY